MSNSRQIAGSLRNTSYSIIKNSIMQRQRCYSSTVPAHSTNERPEPDALLKTLANYVHNTNINSKVAFDTAKYCFLDTLGCGLAALKYEQVRNIIKPIVPGTTVPNGTRVIGTNLQVDPVQGAFSIGTIIRWLDFNDCWLAAEWGHPSDNLGGILAVADYQSRLYNATQGKQGKLFTVNDVLEALIKAHEIQGVIALDNSFNKLGLDHVVLVKIATTAVVSKMLGLTEAQTIEAISQAFVDGQSLRTYRHSPNTGSRKSWAAGDAVSKAVNLAYKVKNANVGTIPSVLTAKTWGFYDVLCHGKPFEFKQRKEFNSYVMENILFKISFPAEFHAQTAAEAAIQAHTKLKSIGKTYADIKSVRIRTQEAAVRIIDKSGPLYNYADRDHCIQYMTAIPLIYGELTSNHYQDKIAENPAIDNLRSKMFCVEDKQFSQDYMDPEKRSIANALLIELNDGTTLDEIVVEYPIGHHRRRDEGIPLLKDKFARHLNEHFVNQPNQAKKILEISEDSSFTTKPINEFVDEFCK
ncbi:hypothetical protein TBLA_0C05240 [Henningerozyma blattae CBS 6284]|uniref:2-methylcitrate dehydratase n=1 Tax=Henningerozyma blattae (strain ATCC 34711 / CBS 6284 / DSM 70876 / NBRC 10599 / NRRL Y-10934 / UCD 77-7) TaxID=1071380 RepID=I2H1R8_HENB6|nr:hypothetical protein TBLA_0C05240 [Tetrapisispora blattae CBS 6284]CCH60320.1 hypothetical protein TBLA_0C05240 [Tetrapisispora blattae CBS 6284]